ncbi:hypothetical protein ACWGNF_20590 [Streptomyces sp. NPDC055808]
MVVLLALLLVLLFGLGFLNALWWVAAAVVLFGLFRYRSGGFSRWGSGEGDGFRDYRDYRDRQDRWSRRYDRQRRGRRRHESRGDR